MATNDKKMSKRGQKTGAHVGKVHRAHKDPNGIRNFTTCANRAGGDSGGPHYTTDEEITDIDIFITGIHSRPSGSSSCNSCGDSYAQAVCIGDAEK